jgi:hypothetical protein
MKLNSSILGIQGNAHMVLHVPQGNARHSHAEQV